MLVGADTNTVIKLLFTALSIPAKHTERESEREREMCLWSGLVVFGHSSEWFHPTTSTKGCVIFSESLVSKIATSPNLIEM